METSILRWIAASIGAMSFVLWCNACPADEAKANAEGHRQLGCYFETHANGLRVTEFELAHDEDRTTGLINYRIAFRYVSPTGQVPAKPLPVEIYWVPYETNEKPGIVACRRTALHFDRARPDTDAELVGGIQRPQSGWMTWIVVARSSPDDHARLLAHQTSYVPPRDDNVREPKGPAWFQPPRYLARDKLGTYVDAVKLFGTAASTERPTDTVYLHVEYGYATNAKPEDGAYVTSKYDLFLIPYDTSLQPHRADWSGAELVSSFRNGRSLPSSTQMGHDLADMQYGGWATVVILGRDPIHKSPRLLLQETRYVPLLSPEEVKELYEGEHQR